MPNRSFGGASAFHSGANDVTLAQWEGCACIQKTYRTLLKAYPVQWPMSRVYAETYMLRLLGERLRGTRIRSPELFRQTQDTLWMEYCLGRTLAETETKRLSDPLLWQTLFSVLYELWNISWEELPQDMRTLLREQEKILDCMLAWKTDGALPCGLRPDCLCLGDVSIHNILYDGERFTLLDFECTHWGFRGYDIGQLLAMTAAAWAGDPVLPVVEQAFFHAVPEGAARQACLFWKEKLLPYYFSRRPGAKTT